MPQRVTWGMIGGNDCKKSKKIFGGDGYIILIVSVVTWLNIYDKT